MHKINRMGVIPMGRKRLQRDIRKSPHEHFTQERKAIFLEEYTKTGLKIKSLLACGASTRIFHTELERDPEFREKCELAYVVWKESLEEELLRRAIKGTQKDVFFKGDKIGEETVFSDRLMELAIKRHNPSYRDKQQIDVNHSGGVMVITGSLSIDDWAQKAKAVNESNAAKLIEGSAIEVSPTPSSTSLSPANRSNNLFP